MPERVGKARKQRGRLVVGRLVSWPAEERFDIERPGTLVQHIARTRGHIDVVGHGRSPANSRRGPRFLRLWTVEIDGLWADVRCERVHARGLFGDGMWGGELP